MRTHLVVSFALLLTSPALVIAQSNTAQQDREQAKEYFKKAEAFYKINDYEQALENYKQSYLLSQEPVLLYNMAQCYRLLGKPEDALRTYKTFVKDSPANAKFVKEAKKFTKELEELIKKKTDLEKANPTAVGTPGNEPRTQPSKEPATAPVSQPTSALVPAQPEEPRQNKAPFLVVASATAASAAVFGSLSFLQVKGANDSLAVGDFAASASQASRARAFGLASDVLVGATLASAGLAYWFSPAEQGADQTGKRLVGASLGGAALTLATSAVALRAAGQASALSDAGSFEESARKLSIATSLGLASTALGGLTLASGATGLLLWKVEEGTSAPKYLAVGSALGAIAAGSAALFLANQATELAEAGDFEASAAARANAKVLGLTTDVLGGVSLGSVVAASLLSRSATEKAYTAKLSPKIGGAALTFTW